MSLLENQVALITGGARGQGRAHALACARAGADVILVDLADQIDGVPYRMGRREDLDETVRQVEQLDRQALAFTGDIRSQQVLDNAVSCAIAEFGKLDILIANAGIWTTAPFWELTDQAWDNMIGTNLTGAWKSAKAVAPHMINRQSGSIVFTASVNAHEGGENFAHYTAAKHGLLGLMKTIALELAPFGVRCNAISPGAIKTPMTDHQTAWDRFAGHEGGTEADLMEAGYSFGALKGMTFLPPDVIADAAVFLNSAMARAITGVALPVDAGHLILAGINPNPTR